MAPIDLSAAPFNLDDAAIAWVHATRDSLSPRDKLAQLFVLLARGTPDETAEAVRSFKPGGITRIYSDDLIAEYNLAQELAGLSAIPL
ncbi:MAG: glycoside hydrolase family 3 protein, partial [Alphaproteobacteria bacterium]|nr:glycoside hydrolase family 3 protein [Alphaproteobacteria bacterium]